MSTSMVAGGKSLVRSVFLGEKTERAITELGSDVTLAALLRDINVRAGQARVSHGRLEWGFVEGLQHVRREAAAIETPPEEVVTCSIPNRRASLERLVGAIDSLGERLLRLKGVVDLDEGPCLVESVFGTFSERQLGEESARYGTTALGWKIPKAELSRVLEAAFLPEPESLIQISTVNPGFGAG